MTAPRPVGGAEERSALSRATGISGKCGAESLIGQTTAGAGAGPDPFCVPRQCVPHRPIQRGAVRAVDRGARAGRAVRSRERDRRAGLRIGSTPTLRRASSSSDPLPTILQGMPLDLRTVNVTIDRPGFMFNPTNCSPLRSPERSLHYRRQRRGVQPVSGRELCDPAVQAVVTVSTQAKTAKQTERA